MNERPGSRFLSRRPRFTRLHSAFQTLHPTVSTPPAPHLQTRRLTTSISGMEYRFAALVQLMDNGGVKKFTQQPVKAPQGGEENVLKGLFSQNLRWLRLEDYHRLYIPGLKIGRQWRIPAAGCALSNPRKLTFFTPPPKRKQQAVHMDEQRTRAFFPLTLHRRLDGRLAVC